MRTESKVTCGTPAVADRHANAGCERAQSVGGCVFRQALSKANIRPMSQFMVTRLHSPLPTDGGHATHPRHAAGDRRLLGSTPKIRDAGRAVQLGVDAASCRYRHGGGCSAGQAVLGQCAFQAPSAAAGDHSLAHCKPVMLLHTPTSRISGPRLPTALSIAAHWGSSTLKHPLSDFRP